MDYWLPIIVLFGAFFFMLALGKVRISGEILLG
ncbi:C4-dicarboxylate transport system large permease component [Escherichia coli]|nr:C4-dicarboxylate transport system large permease component [Escherichia coli]